MDRHLGRIRVSSQLFLMALGFPDDAKIIACYGERAGYPGDIDFVIEHSDLPSVPECGEAELLSPQITLIGPKPSKWIEFDWNLENK